MNKAQGESLGTNIDPHMYKTIKEVNLCWIWKLMNQTLLKTQ